MMITPNLQVQFGMGNGMGMGMGMGPQPVQLMPGDPRLGGNLCGKCRGSGQVSFFLDKETCPICAGLGRVVL